MEYTIDTLMFRIKNGESVEKIADEMTSMLNQAVAKQKEHEAQEKAKIEAQKAQKRSDCADLVNAFFYFLNTWYPEVCSKEFSAMSQEDKKEITDLMVDLVIESFDQASHQMSALSTLNPAILDALLGEPDRVATKKPNHKKMTEDEILADWINKFIK